MQDFLDLFMLWVNYFKKITFLLHFVKTLNRCNIYPAAHLELTFGDSELSIQNYIADALRDSLITNTPSKSTTASLSQKMYYYYYDLLPMKGSFYSLFLGPNQSFFISSYVSNFFVNTKLTFQWHVKCSLIQNLAYNWRMLLYNKR